MRLEPSCSPARLVIMKDGEDLPLLLPTPGAPGLAAADGSGDGEAGAQVVEAVAGDTIRGLQLQCVDEAGRPVTSFPKGEVTFKGGFSCRR